MLYVQNYNDDVISGAGTDWISCRCHCGRWFHEDFADPEEMLVDEEGKKLFCIIKITFINLLLLHFFLQKSTKRIISTNGMIAKG